MPAIIETDPLKVNGQRPDDMSEDQLRDVVEELARDLDQSRKEMREYREKALRLAGIK